MKETSLEICWFGLDGFSSVYRSILGHSAKIPLLLNTRMFLTGRKLKFWRVFLFYFVFVFFSFLFFSHSPGSQRQHDTVKSMRNQQARQT